MRHVTCLLLLACVPAWTEAPNEPLTLGCSGFAGQTAEASTSWRARYVSWEADVIRRAGFGYDRTLESRGGPFAWEWVERTRGRYDFRLGDERVRACAARGLRTVAILQPIAFWEQGVVGPLHLPADMNAYREYVRRVVERYDGDGVDDMPGLPRGFGVHHFEIWNEPEFRLVEGIDGYVTLLRETAEVIRRADPRAILLNGGCAPIWGLGRDGRLVYGGRLIEFWEGVLSRGGAAWIDVWNVHDWVGPELKPVEDYLRPWRELLARHDIERPIWVTEFGNYEGDVRAGTPDGNPWPFQPPAQQAAILVRRASQAFGHGARVATCSMIDHFGANDAWWLKRCDLLFDTSTPKPAYWAVQRFTETIRGAMSAEVVRESADAGQVRFRCPDRDVFLFWGRAGEEVLVEGLSGAEARLLAAVPDVDPRGRAVLRRGRPVFSDMVVPVSGGRAVVRLRETPIYLAVRTR